MLDDYVRAIAVCETVNQFNRLHVDIEWVIGPAEADELARGILARVPALPAPSLRWARGMQTLMARSGRPTHPMRRRSLHADIQLHRMRDGPERGERTLVYCFTDVLRRMMMPIAVYLQFAPVPDCDYLVIADRRQRMFLDGMPGIASDLPGLVAELPRLAGAARYRRVMSVGVSGGGLAALWAALALDLARGVSIGGATPATLAEQELASATPLDAFAAVARARGGTARDLLYVYGEHNERDRAKGEELAALLPCRREALAGVTQHNMLAELYAGDRLGPFLERIHRFD